MMEENAAMADVGGNMMMTGTDGNMMSMMTDTESDDNIWVEI